MIESKNLTKRFGSILAIDSLTVKIPEGFNLILGPNGGGKSTFFKLVTGVYKPTFGKVSLFGEDPWRSSKVKAKIGVAYDPVAFPPLITGKEWLEFIARSKGHGEDEVRRVEKLFKLDFLDERTSGYSSGMLKKLAVAQAFIGEPELVMIDEPFANVDFQTMGELLKLFRRLKENTNFLLISHVWEPLKQLVENVYVISNGRLIVHGEAKEHWSDIEKLFRFPDFE